MQKEVYLSIYLYLYIVYIYIYIYIFSRPIYIVYMHGWETDVNNCNNTLLAYAERGRWASSRLDGHRKDKPLTSKNYMTNLLEKQRGPSRGLSRSSQRGGLSPRTGHGDTTLTPPNPIASSHPKPQPIHPQNSPHLSILSQHIDLVG